jgi:hypothetical protein
MPKRDMPIRFRARVRSYGNFSVEPYISKKKLRSSSGFAPPINCWYIMARVGVDSVREGMQ